MIHPPSEQFEDFFSSNFNLRKPAQKWFKGNTTTYIMLVTMSLIEFFFWMLQLAIQISSNIWNF